MMEYLVNKPGTKPLDALRAVAGDWPIVPSEGVFVGLERVVESRQGNTRIYQLDVRDRRGLHRPIKGDLVTDLAYVVWELVRRGVWVRQLGRKDLEEGRVEVTVVVGRRFIPLSDLLSEIRWGVEGVVAGNRVVLPQTMVLRGYVGDRLLRFVESHCGGCSAVELFSVRIFVEDGKGGVIERDLTRNSLFRNLNPRLLTT